MDFSYLPGCMFPHLSPKGFFFFWYKLKIDFNQANAKSPFGSLNHLLILSLQTEIKCQAISMCERHDL